GPRRYFDLFSLNLSTGYTVERKIEGEVIGWRFEDNAKPRIPLPPTSYMDREQEVSQKIVNIYNAYESKRSNKTTGNQEGARLLEADAEHGIKGRKVATMESRREIGADKRTGTIDENGGKLFG